MHHMRRRPECRISCDIRLVECIMMMRQLHCPRNYWAVCRISKPRWVAFYLCASGEIVRRGGIVVLIPCSRNRCADLVTYRRVRQHVRSTPYFMARATDQVSAACYYCYCGWCWYWCWCCWCCCHYHCCWMLLGYVIYRLVKGSVKISVAATRMRVSAMSCICSLSWLKNGRDDFLAMFALPMQI